jgi:hypothetical protein
LAPAAGVRPPYSKDGSRLTVKSGLIETVTAARV